MDSNFAHSVDIVIGFALPPLNAVILKSHWSRPVRGAVSFCVMLAVAALTAYAQGALADGSMITKMFYVLASAVTSYKSLWEPTGVSNAIESATTPKPENQ